jgi:hypothetical protein
VRIIARNDSGAKGCCFALPLGVVDTVPSMAKKTKKAKRRKISSRRELINMGTDKRYVRRRKGGQFKESDDVGRSLSADRRTKAKTKAKRGQGDRGD